jgi:thymidylate kinase
VLLLDADPSLGLSRIGDSPDTFEEQGALEKCRRVFLVLEREFPWIVLIKADQSPEKVAQDIWHAVEPLLLKNNNPSGDLMG